MDAKKVREAIKALKITIDIGKQKIEYSKTFEPKNDNEPIEKSIEHAKTAIEALEKQLPKKPTYKGDGYAPDGTFIWDEWLCSHCGSGYEVDYDDYNYCPNCGQRIDREEEENERTREDFRRDKR